MRKVLFFLLFGVTSFGVLAANPQAQNPASAQPVPAAAAAPAPPSLDGALNLYRTGNYDEAAGEYNALIAAGTQPALAYAGLARADIRLGKLGEANTAAAKALEIAPGVADAHVALGEVYFRQGKIAEAEQEFVGMVREGTGDARAYLGMARVSEVNSYYKQAKQMIDEAHALDSKDPDITRVWLRSSSYYKRTESLAQALAEPAKSDDKEAVKTDDTGTELPAANPSNNTCRQISKTTSMQVSLVPMMVGPVQYHGYGLDVKVNGTSSRLMLDTGASGIVIDRKIAEKAKVIHVAKDGIGGIGDKGDTAGYVGLADSIKIGDLEFKGCYVEVVDKNSVIGDDGIIGADVFSHYLVDMDFPNAKLKLSELPPHPDQAKASAGSDSQSGSGPHLYNRYVAPQMQSFTPIFRFGHDLLIPTKVNDGAVKLFLLDTGASNTSISPSTARDVTRVSVDEDSRVEGLSGSVKNVFMSDKVLLTFANMRQQNQDLLSFDTSSISRSDGTEVAGIIGFVTLYRLDVKIDYRDGLVKFEFDKKRWDNYSVDGR
jgi:tetratricopeptide (TPR) repeat protein